MASFGEKILGDNGAIDRKKLGKIVFASQELRKKLESMAHPLIYQQLEEELQSDGVLTASLPWFYEASLLFETGAYKKFKQTWCIFCSKDVQLKRLLARDNRSEDECRKIIAAQISNERRAELADIMLDSECPMEEFILKIQRAVDQLNVPPKQ